MTQLIEMLDRCVPTGSLSTSTELISAIQIAAGYHGGKLPVIDIFQQADIEKQPVRYGNQPSTRRSTIISKYRSS